MQTLFTLRSMNRKTGRIPVSMTEKASCPSVCRLRRVCYAQGGGMTFTWARFSERRMPSLSWERFCAKVAAMGREVSIWRHNQAGDLPGRANKLYRSACMDLVTANSAGNYNRNGFTYTHYTPIAGRGVSARVAGHNAEVISDMIDGGFTVNLSADSPAHADQLAELEIAPVVTMLPKDTAKGFRLPSGRMIVICPALTRDTTCKACKLCAQLDRRVVVGFPAHGMATNKASAIAETAAPF